jgi:diguanylate cyclase (GGDEF)-like protein
MVFDLFTLSTVVVLTLAFGACLLLMTWLQVRHLAALALWAASFALAAVAAALILGRGNIADIWSILIGNAMLAAAHGIMWTGVRSFEDHSTPVPLTLAGSLVWLIACQFEAFYAAPAARAALMSTIVVVYSVMAAVEFWRGRSERLMSRGPIIAVLLFHALVSLIRLPLADIVLPVQGGSVDVYLGSFTFLILETIFYTFGIVYMFGGVARERIALRYKHASRTDPLTGVANRREFFQCCARFLHRMTFEHSPSVFLLFDLDEFKSINDTFGHLVGDHVLTEFCRIATSLLRPGDVFGRIGGEEFGCLVRNASLEEGRDIAERIRKQFGAAELSAVEGTTIRATVSVGIAAAVGPDQDLMLLITRADQALYRAKAAGRNRVEWRLQAS